MKSEDVSDRILQLINMFADGNKTRFAEILGISKTNIQDWTNPKRLRLPAAEHLANIRDKLNISIDWLLTGEGEMKSAGDMRGASAVYGQNVIEVRDRLERQCVEKLLRILRSDDDLIKGAIIPNLNAFDDRLIEKARVKKNTANER